MNKRHKKKFDKKLRLKRYDTIEKLHKLNKMRIKINNGNGNNEYVTASMGVVSCGITQNNRIYPANALRDAMMNTTDNDVPHIVVPHDIDTTPTFSIRSI